MKAIAFTQHGLPIEDPTSLIDMDLPKPKPGPRDLLVETLQKAWRGNTSRCCIMAPSGMTC